MSSVESLDIFSTHVNIYVSPPLQPEAENLNFPTVRSSSLKRNKKPKGKKNKTKTTGQGFMGIIRSPMGTERGKQVHRNTIAPG